MRPVLAALLLALAGCATSPPDAAEDYAVVLSRTGADDWTADYSFTKAAPAWLLPRTHPDLDGRAWRPQAWTVMTPGVRLERRGAHDVLVGDGRPLTRVRIGVKPFTIPLQADYTPVLAFSDGGQAHYDRHYEVLPLVSAAQADTLPEDLNGSDAVQDARGRFVLRDPGRRLLVGGRATRDEATSTLEEGVYVYSGATPVLETSAIAAVVDAGLPTWVRTELEALTPRLLGLYRDRLGAPKGGRPTVFAAWGGGGRRGSSLSGSVLPGLVVMSLSGAGLNEPSEPALARVRWFLAHESAHFWLGETVGYERRDGAWITEGGANLLAVRALQQLAPEAEMKTELQGYLDGCLAGMRPGVSLAAAAARGADDGPQYTCGAMLYLAAERALARREPGADVQTFTKRFIDAHRTDGSVTAEDWLTAFQAVTERPDLTASVRRFIREGVDDPEAFMADLLMQTGVPHRSTPDGLRLD